VVKVITGGPADLSGQIKIDDKIIGVAQAKEKDVTDVIGWRLDDVVDLIHHLRVSKEIFKENWSNIFCQVLQEQLAEL
jgi:carboxyl-terminal processing protease